MNAPFKPEALPEWRLDDLYGGRDDPRIDTDLKDAERINGELAAMKGQFTAARADPATLGARLDRGIQLYEDATNALWGVGAFASLAASTARSDPAWSKFEADLRARSSQIVPSASIAGNALTVVIARRSLETASTTNRALPSLRFGARLFPASKVTLRGGSWRLQRIRVEGRLSAYTGYRAPFCSRYASTCRTPCALVKCTVTGVLTPMVFTAGMTLNPVPEDNTRREMNPATARNTKINIAFTSSPGTPHHLFAFDRSILRVQFRPRVIRNTTVLRYTCHEDNRRWRCHEE